MERAHGSMDIKAFRLVLVLALLLGLAAGSHAAPAPAPATPATVATHIVRGPFIQNLTSDGATICWDTDTACGANEVIIDPGSKHPLTIKDATSTAFHKLVVRGLTPDSTHTFQVSSAGSAGARGVLHTAPVQAVPFTFIAYGDSRGNHAMHSKLVKIYMKYKPALVLNTGDVVSDGRKPDEWPLFFADIAPVMASPAAYYVSIGNHEENSANFDRLLALPGNGRWYSFDYAKCHFVVLDSNPDLGLNPQPWYRQEPSSPQYRWLEKDLAQHQDARFIFVFFHHPLYSTGNHGGQANLRSWWKPLFDKYRVSAVFNGHDHDYERSLVDGIPYVVTGGGGAGLHHTTGQAPETLAKFSVYHFCVVRVAGNKAEVTMVDEAGKVRDRFTLAGRQMEHKE